MTCKATVNRTERCVSFKHWERSVDYHSKFFWSCESEHDTKICGCSTLTCNYFLLQTPQPISLTKNNNKPTPYISVWRYGLTAEMSRLHLKNYLKQKYHLSSCIKYFIYKVTEMVKMVEYNFPGLVFMHTVQKMKLFILLYIEAIISRFWCYCFCLKFDSFNSRDIFIFPQVFT